jgi:hypothetical protein
LSIDDNRPVPDRAAHEGVVVAGEHDHGQTRLAEDGAGPLKDRRVKAVMFENVARQQDQIGPDRARGVYHGCEGRVSVAAPGAGGIAVIDMQVRAVDDENVFLSGRKGHWRRAP